MIHQGTVDIDVEAQPDVAFGCSVDRAASAFRPMQPHRFARYRPQKQASKSELLSAGSICGTLPGSERRRSGDAIQ